MTISIAMATHNGEKYLQEQLDSFLQQTILPDELVIFDDFSNDNTVQIIHAFKEKSPFKVFLYVNQENKGILYSFSNALEHCSGDYIFISDQDDVWKPNKIEKVIKCFNENPNKYLIIHDLSICKSDLSLIGQTKIERMKNSFNLENSYIVGMATAIRSPLLKLCLPIPICNGLAYDGWLHSCAVAIDAKYILKESLALYRRHSNNATSVIDINVDFKTSPNYYKSISKKIRSVFKNTPKTKSQDLAPTLQWLIDKKSILLSNGYISESKLDRLIEEGNIRHKINQIRFPLAKMPRRKRIITIAKLYIRGEYRIYNGINTAIKDLLQRRIIQ
jgi:glycosyltransferase involved in cell wall biosynthesis